MIMGKFLDDLSGSGSVLNALPWNLIPVKIIISSSLHSRVQGRIDDPALS
jgi:hypothetical protein